jgi:hypothetical protein
MSLEDNKGGVAVEAAVEDGDEVDAARVGEQAGLVDEALAVARVEVAAQELEEDGALVGARRRPVGGGGAAGAEGPRGGCRRRSARQQEVRLAAG